MPGADQLGRDDGVVAVHRVVAADRHQRDVDRGALRDQLQVAEQAGVAEVVDGRAAEVDHQAAGVGDGAVGRRRSCGTPAPASPSPSRTRPCRRGWGRRRSRRPACRASRGLDQRRRMRRRCAWRPSTASSEVVDVPVREQDVRRVDARPALTAAFGLFGARKGSIRTRLSPSDSSKVAWPRKRMSIGNLLWFGERGTADYSSALAPRDAARGPAPSRRATPDQHPDPAPPPASSVRKCVQPLLRVLERRHASRAAARVRSRTSRPRPARPPAPAGAGARPRATRRSASRKRSGSLSASIAARSCSSREALRHGPTVTAGD